jgi:hypothetical protein
VSFMVILRLTPHSTRRAGHAREILLHDGPWNVD